MKLKELEQLYKLEHVCVKIWFYASNIQLFNYCVFWGVLNHIASLVLIDGGMSSSLLMHMFDIVSSSIQNKNFENDF
jgi:hypothetical protein